MPQTILITGCSSGFGARTAHLFADRGWNVVATARRPPLSGELAAHDRVLATRLDVEDRASIDAAVAAGIARFGGLDAVVNNAGYGLFAVFEGVPRAAVERQFAVNVFGAMDVTRAVLPHFRARRRGTIVNVSSGVGVFGAPMASLYSASKFALEGFSEALWYELASLGVRVKIVEPGGATGTSFMARSAAEVNAVVTPADYAPFLEQIGRIYGGMAAGSDPDAVEKVAAAIYDAVTDGTDRLRYAPTDDIRPILDARRGTSEERYQALVRGLFAPPRDGEGTP